MTAFTSRGLAWRIFFTCWLVYALHLATNTVREIYLGLAIADHLSFRVDEYGGLHPDLFESPGRGWHIGNNPGASMLAAVPYALCRPLVDPVVAAVNRSRAASGAAPPVYNSPWPMARRFFEESWLRGLDVKFGFAALIMQAFCMAPLSAASAVLVFWILRALLRSDRAALWLALLYAFGTPVFYRTGYINQNLLAGHFALASFAALWFLSGRRAAVLAGLAAGTCVLLDYSGLVLLGASFAYCLWVRRGEWLAFAAGTVPPVLLLWFYQWQSFGNPFLPGQHYMPPVEWIERGYQGVSGPQLDLAWMLLADYRFGLFLTCPLFLLALAAPWLKDSWLPRRELAFVLGTPLTLWLFFSCVHYTRLQYNTGLRYLAPALPFLFLAAAVTLTRLPRRSAYLIALAAVVQAWSMAMFRDVERGLGVFDPLARVLLGGFQLPALTALSRVAGSTELIGSGVSPLFLFAVSGAVLYGIWREWA
jgi:hypothetical protein